MRRALPVPVVLTALVLAGCSSSPSASTGSSASVSTGTTAPASAPSSSSSSAAGPQLTGARLKSVLAPASWFPKGFTVEADGARDSGLDGKPAQPAAAGTLPCSRLNGTAWIELGGVAATAFAQDDYVNAAGGQYIQEVDEFAGSSARQVMANLGATVKRCASFHDDQSGATVKVSAVKGPKLGDASLAIRLRGSNWAGDVTLQAVRVGTHVVTVAYAAAGGRSAAQTTKLSGYVVGALTKALATA